MIEINLHPGGRRKGTPFGGLWRSLALPRWSGRMPPVDRWSGAAAAAVVLALLGIGWMALQVGGAAEELEVRVEAAVSDSTRLGRVIERSEALQARQDSIARRVAIIQEVDDGRYVWPRLMDEVARALPDYTWLTRLARTGAGNGRTFEIQGRAATYFALTTFMENLEGSPFIRGVRLVASDQVAVQTGGGEERLVYHFALEGARADPPAEALETVPLFGPSVLPPGNEGI